MKTLDDIGRRLYQYQKGDIVFFMESIESDETSCGVVRESKKNYVTLEPGKVIGKYLIYEVEPGKKEN